MTAHIILKFVALVVLVIFWELYLEESLKWCWFSLNTSYMGFTAVIVTSSETVNDIHFILVLRGIENLHWEQEHHTACYNENSKRTQLSGGSALPLDMAQNLFILAYIHTFIDVLHPPPSFQLLFCKIFVYCVCICLVFPIMLHV